MAMSNPCASTADGGNEGEQPEPDYIKMFVGQIPRAMNEQDLIDMFSEFGRVYQLNLLRDKFTGVSKGEILLYHYYNMVVTRFAVYRVRYNMNIIFRGVYLQEHDRNRSR